MLVGDLICNNELRCECNFSIYDCTNGGCSFNSGAILIWDSEASEKIMKTPPATMLDMRIIRIAQDNSRLILEAVKDQSWICTDPDSAQYRRTAFELDPSGDVFELYQIQEIPSEDGSDDPKAYKIAHGFVDLNEIELKSVLDCYGYESLEVIQKEYGTEWKGILAECQFELESACLDNIVSGVPMFTFSEAEKFIKNYVGEQ